jgi:hypothetical protein
MQVFDWNGWRLFVKTCTKMRFWSILRFSIIVNASQLDCSFKCVPKKVFHLSYDQRIALLLIRKYENVSPTSRKNTKKFHFRVL